MQAESSLVVGGVSLVLCLLAGAFWSIKRLLRRPQSWAAWLILVGCVAYPVGGSVVAAHLWDARQVAEVLVDLIIGTLAIGLVLAFTRPDFSKDSNAANLFATGQIGSLLLIAIFRVSAVLGGLVVLVVAGWALFWLPEARRKIADRADGFVDCPPDAVFRNLADPARMPLLSPSVKVDVPSEGSLAPGFRYRYWLGPRLLPRIAVSVQISEYRPPELIAEVHRFGDEQYLLSWTLQPEGSGTRAQFRQQRTLRFGDALLGAALMAAIIRPNIRRRLRRLEAVCKADEAVR